MEECGIMQNCHTLRGTMRFLIVKPEALLVILERAADGEYPEELMLEILDLASETIVNLTPEENG